MNAVAKIRDLLGGEPLTGPLRSEFDLVRLVRRGLPTEAVDHFLRVSHLNFNLIEEQVMPRRTFRRRQAAHEPLDPKESDRMLRLVRLVALAEETFGDATKANTWLNRENRILEGHTPLALSDTEQGARSVEVLLGRIGHGLAA
jgi:putative toxin-antitoxin system antitoxin component (TIGR02293 family)